MITIADRIKHLGTETAFAVTAEANAFAAKGNTIYPFHIGDLNFQTPSTIVEGSIRAIKEGKTGYCPNPGITELRTLLAEYINSTHNTNYTAENVSIQPGGKPIICKTLLALMNPFDEVLYPTPGYPIYESQIQFIGGVAKPYRYIEGETNFDIDMEMLKHAITKKTKILILNDLQNPTGAECTMQELEQIAELAIKHDLIVLSDEAYFDIHYEGKSYSIASLPGMQERTVILYTFSKKYAMTGWRLGAAIGPKEIIDVITKLNANFESCSNHFIQYGAIEGIRGDQKEIHAMLKTLKERRDTACTLLNSIDGIRCLKPNATFYLFPNVTEVMKRRKITSYEEFRKSVLYSTGVSFCTRLQFGHALAHEHNYYIRLAYGGIQLPNIIEGLEKLKRYLES